MNADTKYVVSRTLEDAGTWQNLILLRGDAADLKARPGGDLASSAARRWCEASLRAADLIDR